MAALFATLTRLFWLWTILGVAWAWHSPAHFAWFKDYISIGLGVIMLGMGLTISVADFRAVLRQPAIVGLGVLAQFVVMPLLGFFIARTLRLEPGLAAGLILVSCCPGGTASNVIAFLARANVALSVLMTLCSTLLAVLLTPLLTKILAQQYVEVDAGAMLLKALVVVLLPVAAGIAINLLAPRQAKALSIFSPLVSVIVIVLIVGFIIGANKVKIQENFGVLLLAVFLLHALGFALGYLVALLSGRSEDYRRTLAIEVGMQNSGLGAALARTLPSSEMAALAAVPCALSAACHCLIGSLVAAVWRAVPPTVCEDP